MRCMSGGTATCMSGGTAAYMSGGTAQRLTCEALLHQAIDKQQFVQQHMLKTRVYKDTHGFVVQSALMAHVPQLCSDALDVVFIKVVVGVNADELQKQVRQLQIGHRRLKLLQIKEMYNQ